MKAVPSKTNSKSELFRSWAARLKPFPFRLWKGSGFSATLKGCATKGPYARQFLPSAASASAAGMTATVASLTASGTASPTAPATIAITPAAWTTLTSATTFRTAGTGFDGRYDSIHAVEVGLVVGIEIRAAFNHCCGHALRYWRCRFRSAFRLWRRSATHFGSLLFQNCFTG
jgi:hypothetical protein